MKVILLKDVAKLGRRFEIVDVPSGHALNKLIPQGLAQEATAQNLKNIKARAEKTKTDQVTANATFAEAIAALKDTMITISAPANDQGHLFQALRSKNIEEALQKEGISITESQIHIEEPIKSVGEHSIPLVHGDETSTLTITVTAA